MIKSSRASSKNVTLTGGLLGQYKQPNGGLLGLAAGMMAVMATASLANQVFWGARLGAGPSLAWAGVGALSVGLIWRYQVCILVLHPAVSTPLHLQMLCVHNLIHSGCWRRFYSTVCANICVNQEFLNTCILR